MDNPLEILGLKPGDTLKKAHKHRNALFVKLHPDKNPSEKIQYQKVYDAYLALEKNPELLEPRKIILPHNENIIRIEIIVEIEDFYFKKPQTITVNRRIFCKKCHGTGSSKGINGRCIHCNGKGKIESNIFALLGKDNTCPICRGTGINLESICSSCNGSKYEIEKKSIQFVIDLYDYNKKIVILHNVGHQIGENQCGSITVYLKIIQDNTVKIEDDYFVVYDKVLPVQKIIGDIKTINIFDRDITYKIEKYSTESFIIDKISPGISQKLRIKYIDVLPVFTDETYKLYKKILEIEKQYEHPIRL